MPSSFILSHSFLPYLLLFPIPVRDAVRLPFLIQILDGRHGVCLLLLKWLNKWCVIGTLVHLKPAETQGKEGHKKHGWHWERSDVAFSSSGSVYAQMNMGKWENPVWRTEKRPQERHKKEMDGFGWLQGKSQQCRFLGNLRRAKAYLKCYPAWSW